MAKSDSECGCHLCPSIGEIMGSPDRLNALYSPFRPRDADGNRDSYDLKMKFWVKVIEEFTSFGNRFTFTLKELQKGLMVQKKTPACLPQVLEHLYTQGTILPQKEFYDYARSRTGWLAWSQVNAKRALSKLVPVYWPFSSSTEIRYVHVTHLQDLVSDFHKLSNLSGNVISLAKFKEIISSQVNIEEEEEMQILLDYLKIMKLIVLDKVGPEEVVLFGGSGTETISDVKKGKYDIHRVMEVLDGDIEKLDRQIEQTVLNAKQALKLNRRATAKHELKRKKLAEQQRDKLINMADTLHVIAMRIEDAETDAKILSAYESGKKALATTLKDGDLTVDRVTETMLDIQDLLETQGEISAAISTPAEMDTSSLEELDEELEQMLKEDEEELKAKETTRREKEEEEALKLLDGLQIGGPLNISGASLRSNESVPSPSSFLSEG